MFMEIGIFKEHGFFSFVFVLLDHQTNAGFIECVCRSSLHFNGFKLCPQFQYITKIWLLSILRSYLIGHPRLQRNS